MFQEMKEKSNLIEEKKNLFVDNMKILFKSDRSREYVIILLMSFLIGFNYIFIALGESFIANSPHLKETDINIIVLFMGLSIILGYLVTGIIADKYGRKPLMYIYSILLPLSIIIVVFGANDPSNALLYVIIGASLANVTYWGLGILIRIMTLEIIPTNARGTGSGIKSVIGALGITAGLLLTSIISLIFGLSIAFLLFSLIILINIPLIRIFLKETKGIDISK